MASPAPVRIDAPPDFELRDLIRLDEYAAPGMPSDETVRQWWLDIRRLLRREDDNPYIDAEELEQTTLGLLDEVVAPPACGPVIDELAASIEHWRAHESTPVKIIVTPPCDENCVVSTWAREHGGHMLAPPDRETILSPVPTPPPDLSGPRLAVIPRLSDWFLRHRNGLGPVRELFEAMADSDRRFVVGCNAWAWAFLEKAVEADLVLPVPEIFRPFDTDRLYHWLHGLARADVTRDVRFRLGRSGRNVFPDEDDGEYDRDFFAKLAARSLGIPWVAWYLWRVSLRSERGGDERPSERAVAAEAADRAESRLTLWIADAEELTLPAHHPEAALLVLHALLIHHSLTIGELRQTVPIVGGSNIVASLVARGFVRREGRRLSCQPSAYPEIRAALRNAGYPMSAI